MNNYGCQQVLIKPNKETKSVLEFICGESNKLHNCGVYYARQVYFKTSEIVSSYDLHKELALDPHFSALYSQVAQQCLTTVGESFKSFVGLLKGIKKGTVNQRPKIPNYRKPGLNLVAYPKQAVSLTNRGLRFPLGNIVKTWFKLSEFYLPMPSNLKFQAIKEFRILPRNGAFYLELVYKLSQPDIGLDKNNVLGLDHGVNNWLTGVSNVGTSFILDGKRLKSVNQWYNKRVAILKTNQSKNFWSKQLAGITEKRNRQMRDAVNQAAAKVIYHCVEHNIGTVVFGWNKDQKQNIKLGNKGNQNFVQIPTGRLKKRIEQLCLRFHLRFIENEESYTSQASFLDSDLLPKYGEKPERWQASGKRIKRGLYRTSDGTLVNSDCNGAANIVSKVAVKLGLDLSGISSGALASPLRIAI